VAVALILMKIIDEVGKERLIEIRFDSDNKQVIFIYKTLFSATKQKTLPLDNARLEIHESKSKRSWLWEPLTLYFLKNKKEVFEIKKSKDGFTLASLRQIIDTVGRLSLPISKV
jgi:hypothetical protein